MLIERHELRATVAVITCFWHTCGPQVHGYSLGRSTQSQRTQALLGCTSDTATCGLRAPTQFNRWTLGEM